MDTVGCFDISCKHMNWYKLVIVKLSFSIAFFEYNESNNWVKIITGQVVLMNESVPTTVCMYTSYCAKNIILHGRGCKKGLSNPRPSGGGSGPERFFFLPLIYKMYLLKEKKRQHRGKRCNVLTTILMTSVKFGS